MPLFYVPHALDDIPSCDTDRLKRKIDWLWINRAYVKHECLHGNFSGFYKRRLGNYRIIYTYDETADDMIIHLVGLRDSIYKNK